MLSSKTDEDGEWEDFAEFVLEGKFTGIKRSVSFQPKRLTDNCFPKNGGEPVGI